MRFNKFIRNLPILPTLFLIVVLYLVYTIYDKLQEGFKVDTCANGTAKKCSSSQTIRNNKCYNCMSNQNLVVTSFGAKCNGSTIPLGTAPSLCYAGAYPVTGQPTNQPTNNKMLGF